MRRTQRLCCRRPEARSDDERKDARCSGAASRTHPWNADAQEMAARARHRNAPARSGRAPAVPGTSRTAHATPLPPPRHSSDAPLRAAVGAAAASFAPPPQRTVPAVTIGCALAGAPRARAEERPPTRARAASSRPRRRLAQCLGVSPAPRAARASRDEEHAARARRSSGCVRPGRARRVGTAGVTRPASGARTPAAGQVAPRRGGRTPRRH
jgi:hypothetical protein